MKKFLSSLLVAMLAASVTALPAHASPTLVSNTLTLGIANDGKTLVRSGDVNISGGGTIFYKTFACPSAESAVTSLAPNTQPMGCNELFNANGGGPFTANDLSFATVMTGQNSYSPYDTSRGAHIVTTAYVSVTLQQYHIRPASVLATNPAPAPLAIVSSQVRPDGLTLRLGLSGMLQGQVNQISTAEFTVSVDGFDQTLGVNASVSGMNIDIPLTSPVVAGAVVTFSRRSGGTVITPNGGGAGIDSISTTTATNNSVVVGQRRIATTTDTTSAPKYTGPEFSAFGAPVLAGDKLVAQGKRLDGITSLKINGAEAAFNVNSASELEIDVPRDLAPGKYDIVITSSHGKLTHLQAFTVKAVVPTKTLEFKGDGRTLGYEELLELTKMAKQIGAEYTSVKCIVNAAHAAVAQRLVSRGCDYVGAIRLRGKEVSTEAKSTFKGDGFWFKVVAEG